MQKLILLSGLALFSLSASAQVATTELVGVNSQNCPVAASAERGSQGAVVQTQKGENGVAENKLYLHFLPDSKSGIREVAITLHGTDGQARTELAASGRGGNLTENFDLTSGSKPDLRNTSVIPTRVVNVRWIGITEIKFADGTSWHPTNDSYCHIQPNGFRLVDASAK